MRRLALVLCVLGTLALAMAEPGMRSEMPLRRMRLSAINKSIVPYPAGHFTGAGVVIVAETLGRLGDAYTTVKQLRDNGVAAPVEVWITGDFSAQIKAEFGALDATVKKLTSSSNTRALSAVAVLQSSFERVLLLDASNTAATDVDELLATTTATGMRFWPSARRADRANPIYALIDKKFEEGFEQCSSQVFINKEQAWRALHIAVHLASPGYQKMLKDNEDVFRLAALATDTAFVMEERAVAVTKSNVQMASLPKGIRSAIELHSCVVRSKTQIQLYSEKTTIDVKKEFVDKNLGDGTTMSLTFKSNEWVEACNLFGDNNGKCNGQDTLRENYKVAFARIDMRGLNATTTVRMRFDSEGTGSGNHQNLSILQVTNWEQNDKDCDAYGDFYNTVAEDMVGGRQYILMAALDHVKGRDLSPPAQLNQLVIKMTYNAGFLAKPVFALLAILAIFASRAAFAF